MFGLNKIYNMDCIEGMKQMPENYVDAIVTDPPYGLEFMGKDWDKFSNGELSNRWQQAGKPSMERFDGHNDWHSKPRPRMINDIQSMLNFQSFSSQWAVEALRILKPGGYLLSFGGTRTYHRMACGIEDAGFEIRDCIMWVYGSGFPKSLNIGKAIDKIQRGNKTVELINALLEEGKTLKELGEMAGIPSIESSYRDWTTGGHKPEERSWERMLKGLGFSEEDGLNIIEKRTVKLGGGNAYTFREGEKRDWEMKITKGNSEWEGWGTALKPAVEPIVVARKPLSEKTVAENVLKWGTGGINIDESRVALAGEWDKGTMGTFRKAYDDPDKTYDGTKGNVKFGGDKLRANKDVVEKFGRFPANLIHDGSDEVVGLFPDTKSQGHWSKTKTTGFGEFGKGKSEYFGVGEKDKQGGSVARFFYCAKASKGERNDGLDEFEQKVDCDRNPECYSADVPFNRSANPKTNSHPTVKPIALMEYLIKMVTKESALVLDPFIGSGTTAIAARKLNRQFIGFEKEEQYHKIAEGRLSHHIAQRKLTEVAEVA